MSVCVVPRSGSREPPSPVCPLCVRADIQARPASPLKHNLSVSETQSLCLCLCLCFSSLSTPFSPPPPSLTLCLCLCLCLFLCLCVEQGSGCVTARLNGTAQLGFTPRGEHFAVTHAGFSVAVCRKGRVYTWGDSAQGCLGLGHVTASFLPRAIPSLQGYVVRQVPTASCGSVLFHGFRFYFITWPLEARQAVVSSVESSCRGSCATAVVCMHSQTHSVYAQLDPTVVWPFL